MGDKSPHPHPLGPQNLEVFAKSHDFTIGAFSATTASAGRDVIIQNITSSSATRSAADISGSIDAQRETIFQHLKAPTFEDAYSSALEQRMLQTGSWFLKLDNFQKFLRSKGVTLWCTGMPGAGKTILASIAIEHLRRITGGSTHTAVAFTFIRYSERYTWRDILTSLLIQLVDTNDLACAIFWPHYYRVARRASPDFTIPESALEAALRDIARRLQKLYVAVDGLDEAMDEVKERLLEILVPSGVNLLILSRPLDLYTEHTPGALFTSIQAQTKDIELYVLGEVQRSPRLKSIFKGKQEKIPELCHKITRQSDGMFLVAKLQMGAIMRSSKSISSLFRNLEALPGGVDAMYSLTLSRIRDSEDSSIAFRALAWTAYHANPFTLSPSFLQHVLSFDPESKTFDPDDITPIPLILSACQGLLTQQSFHLSWEGNNRIRFIHYTTYEYLKAAELDIDGLSNPHSLLALTCLACMEEHRQILLKLVQKDEPDELGMYIQSQPFLGYAHEYWKRHATLSQPHGSVCLDIDSFLSKHEDYPFYFPTRPRTTMEIFSGANLAMFCDFTGMGNPTLQGPQGPLPITRSIPSGYTPFHLAAILGRFETFKSLLYSHSGSNIPSGNGSTVLHIAVVNRQTSFVQQLSDLVTDPRNNLGPEVFDFNVNAQDFLGRTPLMLAIQGGEQALVQLFYSYRSLDCNIQDNKGRSALHYCASQPIGLGEFVGPVPWDAISKTICSMPHSNLNLRDMEGNSAFMLACRSGHEETVKHILTNLCEGRPPFAHHANEHGVTALMMVCIALGRQYLGKGLLAVFDLLVAHGSDLNARDVDGMTPFLHAVEQYDDVVRGNSSGQPPHEVPRVMELLLALDPTLIDQRDDRGRTALMISAEGESPRKSLMLWILEFKGCSAEYLNAQDEDGRTTLLYSCERGDSKALTALLALPGIRIQHECYRGFSAIEWLFPAYYSKDRLFNSRRDGWKSLTLLMKGGKWGPSIVRKVFLRALSDVTEDSDRVWGEHFMAVWELAKDAFIWSLNDSDTIALLAAASLKSCRIPAVLVLVSLGILPESSLAFRKERTGVCPPLICDRRGTRQASKRPYLNHDSLSRALKEYHMRMGAVYAN